MMCSFKGILYIYLNIALNLSINIHSVDGPISGEVRLYYSYYNPIYYRGIVEVYLSEEWGTVAYDGSWTQEDGEVVCRQLGYETSSKVVVVKL